MMRWAAGAACLVVLAAGCVDPDPSTPTMEDLGEIDLSPDHTITVDDGGFRPEHLEVVAGDVVLLVNEGTEAHSFTAEKRFDTGRLEPGEDSTLVLGEPGEIPYWDLADRSHRATIVVTEAAGG